MDTAHETARRAVAEVIVAAERTRHARHLEVARALRETFVHLRPWTDLEEYENLTVVARAALKRLEDGTTDLN